MNTYHVYLGHMSPPHSKSSALEHFERSNAIKIRNGTMFDFYPGLPHIKLVSTKTTNDSNKPEKLVPEMNMACLPHSFQHLWRDGKSCYSTLPH